ncbi:MAG: hypothetical protein KBS83_01585, partial [Lachnospiraceae bacterium]|nr:hypothetical protein [Candidatus Equihabitans merdae]
MQTANALDQAMFSLLGHYDRDLMERYDLFFVDGGYGTAELHHEQTCDFLEEAMSYILSPGKGRLTGGSNLLSLSSESMSITGYTLATDQDGGVFALQAEMAAKETLLTDGLGTLSEGIQGLLNDSQQAEQRANGAEGGLPSEGYAGVKAQAEAAREEAAGSDSSGAGSGTGASGNSGGGEGTPSQVVNPLESIETLRKSSLMNLVCPDAGNISQNTVSTGQLLSGRGKSSGMGMISLEESPYSTGNALYLNRYIMTHFGYYTSPEEGNGLKYPLEQIIKGRNSDQA